MNRNLLAALALAAALPALQGCVTAAAVGAGTVALMVEDRRSTGTYVEDENIEWKVLARVNSDFKSAHVNGTSFNRRVLLTGQAPTEDAKKAIEAAVKSIPEVAGVVNELVVGGNSSMTSRGSDSLITSNVKTRMVGNGKFATNHIKVVTEDGVVYLMGIVTQAEGDAAVGIARSTSGVQRVVKAFEYIAEAPKRN
jgi:osmotically-inducible protein OsmY